MTDFYRHIEVELLRHLERVQGLADVRTFSADVRELVFIHEELAKRFGSANLPALQLTTQLLQTRSRPSAAAELVYEVPLDIDVIVAHQDRNEARNRALELQFAVERELHKLRRGSDAEALWGQNVFVAGDVESNLLMVEGTPHVYAIATIEATVERYAGIDDE